MNQTMQRAVSCSKKISRGDLREIAMLWEGQHKMQQNLYLYWNLCTNNVNRTWKMQKFRFTIKNCGRKYYFGGGMLKCAFLEKIMHKYFELQFRTKVMEQILRTRNKIVMEMHEPFQTNMFEENWSKTVRDATVGRKSIHESSM